MPNTREKMIELLCEAEEQADKRCDGYENCDKCPAENKDVPCEEWLKADCLLRLGVTVQKWIPVTERLPDVAITHNNRWEKSTESVHVLCYCKQKSGKRMVKEGSVKVYASGVTYWMIPGTIDSVTHWMPLPEPPRE